MVVFVCPSESLEIVVPAGALIQRPTGSFGSYELALMDSILPAATVVPLADARGDAGVPVMVKAKTSSVPVLRP
jgi:hypothetical protein